MDYGDILCVSYSFVNVIFSDTLAMYGFSAGLECCLVCSRSAVCFVSLGSRAVIMRTFLFDSLGGIWIVQRNRLMLIGPQPHISRRPVCHSTETWELIGWFGTGRTLQFHYKNILASRHLQMIAGFQGKADHCVQCFSTELTWTFLLEHNDSHWDSWESGYLSWRGGGGGLGETNNDKHHGVRSGRAKLDFHFLDEDP